MPVEVNMSALLTRLSCFVWGHHVDNHVFKQAQGDGRKCHCGADYLAEDGSLTHVRHTLSCFLGKHDYEKLADRDGCHEYVCTQCGHPLLFDAEHDPYAATPPFKKKVLYLCGLFGHRARHVTTRAVAVTGPANSIDTMLSRRGSLRLAGDCRFSTMGK